MDGSRLTEEKTPMSFDVECVCVLMMVKRNFTTIFQPGRLNTLFSPLCYVQLSPVILRTQLK